MFKIPDVGTKVRVTTRYPSYYIYDDIGYQESTYEGEVLPPERFFGPTQFKISGDGRMVFRVIDIRWVRELEILP